ncbi:hypothetical protein BW41_03348 [Sphingomonas sp. RIT328]|nr:hypothetical protein BW41_03348 [Sphingomonas sp. RIT328]
MTEAAHRTDAAGAHLLVDGSRSAALLDWADGRGMSAATALLAGGLARAVEEGRDEFVTGFLAVPQVATGAALDWLLWLWADAPSSMRARLTREEDVLAAEEVMAMHRHVRDGGRFAAAEWRAARRRFASAISSDASTQVVEAIAASMWDLSETPGAIADVAQSWINGMAMIDAIVASGWTVDDHQRFEETWAAFGIAHARQNRREPDEDDAAFAARQQRYMSENPIGLSESDFARNSAWSDERQRRMQHRAAELRAGLLTLVER